MASQRLHLPGAGYGFFMRESAVAIIPARYHSTRLPGKALASIGGRPMVCHVVERARRARGIARVIVATDDTRIAEAARGVGGEVTMTRADHPSGTDRVAEVARGLEATIVVNVQGDLPRLDPAMIERAVACLAADSSLGMATLAAPLFDEAEWRSPHVVKVVVGAGGRALYFSRSPIPHDRDGSRAPGAPLGWRHIGLYAYRRDVLLRLAALPPTPLERREQLEQLRALEHDIAIGVVEWTAAEPLIEVDTADDLARARAAMEGRGAA
ncbi:MAG TPA: 3-deoxy-manno-octulosonate cytidylyltransferase [Candidatus Binatus sp.]|nr:3-deoxy-manno-octulosonate cytidylyltransferase [Candidatus Binatus sp.]